MSHLWSFILLGVIVLVAGGVYAWNRKMQRKSLASAREMVAEIWAERSEDEELNDPFDIWGSKPSYRCYIARHRDCETEGPDAGCTCSCGHQEPVCACGLDDDIADGIVTAFMHRHQLGCPLWRAPQWADVRGPKTWCSHPAEFHGPEAGCIECTCIATTGHRRRTA